MALIVTTSKKRILKEQALLASTPFGRHTNGTVQTSIKLNKYK